LRTLERSGKVTRFKEWRLKRGWSQTECADLCGCTPAYISGVESGAREISAKQKVSLARCLGVRVSELFSPADQAPLESD
jgi:transcriptional regulator with XRE-family HTH domain